MTEKLLRANEGEREQGAIMLEATYCILVCLLIMIFFISFGFYIYQKMIFRIASNEIAEEIVQTYKLENGVNNSEITQSDASEIRMYRYLLGSAYYEKVNARAAQTVLTQRLSPVSMAQSESSPFIEVRTVVDDIGRRHYEVELSQKYRFFLGDLLRLVGGQKIDTLSATVYVSSVDVLHYVNTVKLTKYGLEKLSSSSDILGVINSCIKTMKSLLKLFEQEPGGSAEGVFRRNEDAETPSMPTESPRTEEAIRRR